MQRQIVLVSGAPAAGKTTCARLLAALLGFPLLSKDDIKEALWDALESPAGDRAWSRRVGDAAMEVLWALAAQFPLCGSGGKLPAEVGRGTSPQGRNETERVVKEPHRGLTEGGSRMRSQFGLEMRDRLSAPSILDRLTKGPVR